MACERCVSVDEVNERYLGIIHFFHFLAIILERVQVEREGRRTLKL